MQLHKISLALTALLIATTGTSWADDTMPRPGQVPATIPIYDRRLPKEPDLSKASARNVPPAKPSSVPPVSALQPKLSVQGPMQESRGPAIPSNPTMRSSINNVTQLRFKPVYPRLVDVIGRPGSPANYTHVTANQEELWAILKESNAYFKEHPEVTLVLTAAKNSNELHLTFLNLPKTLKKLSLVGDHVTSFGDSFLDNCTELTTLHLALENATKIGNYFLNDCSGLTTLDFNGIKNVTEIGNAFLHRCTGLTTLKFSPLDKVRSIGKYFIDGSPRLTEATKAAVETFKKDVLARSGK